MTSRLLQHTHVTNGTHTTGIEQAPDLVEDGGHAELRNVRLTNPLESGAASDSDLLYPAALYVLDVLGIGWIVCDAESRVLGVNQTAEAILTNRDGLEVDGQGRLRSACGDNAALSDAIARASEPRRFWTSGVEDVILSIIRGSGKRPLALVVHQVQETLQNGLARPMALLLTLDSSVRPVTSVDLSELFPFTALESNLALLLMEGRRLEDCCAELRIDLRIGEAHLKQLFKKTDTHVRTELVLALFKFIAIARLGAHSFEASASLDATAVH
jgi:DNA-binding CsgD family transcriptional regulator